MTTHKFNYTSIAAHTVEHYITTICTSKHLNVRSALHIYVCISDILFLYVVNKGAQSQTKMYHSSVAINARSSPADGRRERVMCVFLWVRGWVGLHREWRVVAARRGVCGCLSRCIRSSCTRSRAVAFECRVLTVGTI